MTFTNYSVYVFWLFSWEWELELMNHTVSFIQSASPLMESIHKWSFNSNRTPPLRSPCTHNTRPWRTTTGGPSPPTPSWYTCKVNMYKRHTEKVICGALLHFCGAGLVHENKGTCFVVLAIGGLDFSRTDRAAVVKCTLPIGGGHAVCVISHFRSNRFKRKTFLEKDTDPDLFIEKRHHSCKIKCGDTNTDI